MYPTVLRAAHRGCAISPRYSGVFRNSTFSSRVVDLIRQLAKLAEAVQCVGDATLIAGILQGCDREVEIVNCMAMKFDCGVYLAERGK